MDRHLKDFFSTGSEEPQRGSFHSVITLHHAPDIDWPAISRLVPDLCKGWYELSRLPTKDRIEFTRDFWLIKIALSAKALVNFSRAFSTLSMISASILPKKSLTILMKSTSSIA